MRTKIIFFLTNILLFVGNVYAQNINHDSTTFYNIVESFVADSKDYRCQDTLTSAQISVLENYKPSGKVDQSLRLIIQKWDTLKKQIAVLNLSGLSRLLIALKDSYVNIVKTPKKKIELDNWYKQFRSAESLVRYRPESIKKRKTEWEKDFEGMFKYVRKNSYKQEKSTKIIEFPFTVSANQDEQKYEDISKALVDSVGKHNPKDVLNRLANQVAMGEKLASEYYDGKDYKLEILHSDPKKHQYRYKFTISEDISVNKGYYYIDCQKFQKIINEEFNFINKIEIEELRQYLLRVGHYDSVKADSIEGEYDNLKATLVTVLKDYNLPEDLIANFITDLKANLDVYDSITIDKVNLQLKIKAKLSKIENSINHKLCCEIYKADRHALTINKDLDNCNICNR